MLTDRICSGILGDKAKQHVHVFWAVEGGLEVKSLNVGTGALRVFCADDAVPHDLGDGKAGLTCGEFSRVYN